MMTMLRRTVVALGLIVFPASLVAQPVWHGRLSQGTIGLEVASPDFDEALNTTALLMYLTAGTNLSERIRLVGELPYANATVDILGTEVKESGIGNPYIGLEIGGSSPFFTQLGVRIPASGLEGVASILGFIADFDRLEAFVPDLLTVSGAANYRNRSASGLLVHLRVEPAVLIPTNDDTMDDTEILLGYGGMIGYESDRAMFNGGVTGRTVMTEDDGDFSDRSITQASFNGTVWFGNVRPGVHVRIPIDSDLSDALKMVIGGSITIRLR